MEGVERLQDVTKRVLEKGDVELIKSTMQNHEDVFNNQVKELHELYNVQRKLMDKLRHKIDHIHCQKLPVDSSSREHSGSCSEDSTRNSRALNLKRLANAYVSTKKGTIKDRAVSSAEHGHKSKKTIMIDESHEEDIEVELTLSIGGSQSKKRSKPSLPLKHEITLKKVSFSSSFQLEREKESSDPTMSS